MIREHFRFQEAVDLSRRSIKEKLSTKTLLEVTVTFSYILAADNTIDLYGGGGVHRDEKYLCRCRIPRILVADIKNDTELLRECVENS